MNLAAIWQALEQCAVREFQQYDGGTLAHLVQVAGAVLVGSPMTSRRSGNTMPHWPCRLSCWP